MWDHGQSKYMYLNVFRMIVSDFEKRQEEIV